MDGNPAIGAKIAHQVSLNVNVNTGCGPSMNSINRNQNNFDL